MMKARALEVICLMVILFFIAAAGCVAPPKDTGKTTSGGSTGPGGSSGSSGSGDAATPTPQYVTIETPYGGVTTIATVKPTANITTVPVENWVEIYKSTQSYSYNKTAVSFDLKNPPMLIEFTVVPINVTGTKTITNPFGKREEITVKYDYYSPHSWFEVTIRDKATGSILQQDGFGNSYGKQYSQDLKRTIKVYNAGNKLVEMAGSQITATVSIRVKEEKNIIGAEPTPA